jgi:hypothetical protein
MFFYVSMASFLRKYCVGSTLLNHVVGGGNTMVNQHGMEIAASLSNSLGCCSH